MSLCSNNNETYRAARQIRHLGVGQAGSNEGNQSVGELHFDDDSNTKISLGRGAKLGLLGRKRLK